MQSDEQSGVLLGEVARNYRGTASSVEQDLAKGDSVRSVAGQENGKVD